MDWRSGGKKRQKLAMANKHYAPRGASDTPGGYPSAGGAFIVVVKR
jgi:hypothetical protein